MDDSSKLVFDIFIRVCDTKEGFDYTSLLQVNKTLKTLILKNANKILMNRESIVTIDEKESAKKIPKIVEKYKNLKNLSLRKFPGKNLSSFKSFEYLTELNVSCASRLIKLPKNLPNLKILDCAASNIKCVPETYTKLEELDISECTVKHNAIPDTLINLKKLDCFCSDSKYGQFTLPTTLINLERLNIGQSGIRFLSNSFTKLKYLDVYNCFIQVPNTYVNLRVLDYFGCNVTVLPETFKELRSLNISANPIENLPITYTKLVKLRMTATKIRKIPTSYTSLQKIYYNGTNFKELPRQKIKFLERKTVYYNNKYLNLNSDNYLSVNRIMKGDSWPVVPNFKYDDESEDDDVDSDEEYLV